MNRDAAPPRFPCIRLREESLRRVSRGHRWIFSNEVARRDAEVTPGCEVAVLSPKGDFLGSALYSANALIAARIYSRRAVRCDAEYIRAALTGALAMRERFAANPRACRLVFGEGDGLPGLVVDRYGDVLVLQATTAGMEQRIPIVVEELRALLSPAAIVERNDTAARSYEELPERVGVLFGSVPEELWAEINGLSLRVDVLGGQKTGLFLDQAENWLIAERFARDARVLDLFCHAGGWTLHALRGGAAMVTSVDISAPAMDSVRDNIARNNLESSRHHGVVGDVFEFLRESNESWNLIVSDPPAFAKNRKSVPQALRGYREIHHKALRRLAPGGVFIACSCSQNVSAEEFEETVVLAARDAGRQLQRLPLGGQGSDHAPLLSTPESHYLKVLVLVDRPDPAAHIPTED